MPNTRASSAAPALDWLRKNVSGSAAEPCAASNRSGSRSPFAAASCWTCASSSKVTPIIPVPTTQPQRVDVSGPGRIPASSKACAAATSAKRCERFAILSSLRSPMARSTRSGERPLTSAAIRTGKPLASKLLIGATPLRAASNADHVAATSLPAGVTSPRPVIATRRRLMAALAPAGPLRCAPRLWTCLRCALPASVARGRLPFEQVDLEFERRAGRGE